MCSVCSVDPDICAITEEVPPHSSPLHLVSSVYLSPAAHRFFADTNRGSKITFQRCPLLRTNAKGLGSVSFVRLFPSLRSTVYPESLAEEVSNPSLKARRSMSTRHAFALWSKSPRVASCRASPCCPSHTHQVPVVPFHHSQWLCYPSSPTTDIAARHSSSSTSTAARVCASGAAAHLVCATASPQTSTLLHPARRFSEEHVTRRPSVLRPSVLFCCAASRHRIKADRSSVGKAEDAYNLSTPFLA